MSLDEVFIDELLAKAVDGGYSALHLEVGRPPLARAYGSFTMAELALYEPARAAHIQRMIYDILTDEQINQFEDDLAFLFPYLAQHVGKFHVRIVRHKGDGAATFHAVPG